MNTQNNARQDDKELILGQKIKSLSDENRKKLKRFAEIILNEDELQIVREENGNISSGLIIHTAIPFNLLEKECSISNLRDADTLVRKLNQFSSRSFIGCENRFVENLLKSRLDGREESDESYTKNLLVMLDNSAILERIVSVLNGNAPNVIKVSNIPIFDAEKSILTILGYEISFPKQKNEYLMLDLLLNKNSSKETDKTTILDSLGWKNPIGERSPYDTMRSINEKVFKKTKDKIKDLVKHRGMEYFYIDKK